MKNFFKKHWFEWLLGSFVFLGFLYLASIATADTITPRVGLTAPSIGATGWGTTLNNNWTVIDSSVAAQGTVNTFVSSNTFNGNVYLSSGLVVNSSAGTAGQVLQSNGPGTKPTWSNAGAGNVLAAGNNAFTGANTITAADASNQVPLTLIQNDKTNNPNGLVITSTGSGHVQITENGIASGGYQNQIGALTIGDNNAGRNPTTYLAIVDSTTDSTLGDGLLELWENNPNHNSYLLWIHGNSNRNSDEPIRFDGPTYGIDEVSLSTDSKGAHGMGKWKVISMANASVDLQLASSRSFDNTTFENELYVHPLQKGDQPVGLYLQPQSLAFDSGVLSSSDTSSVVFLGQNQSSVGLTGPLNPAGSWLFALPNTPNNQGQVLYQSDNGRGNNFNARSWAFTSGGSTGQFLSFNSGSAPTWTTPTAQVLIASGIAFGSLTNTVSSDSASLRWDESPQTLYIHHTGGTNPYLVMQDDNAGSNYDYLIRMDNLAAQPQMYLGWTNTSAPQGKAGMFISTSTTANNESVLFASGNGGMNIASVVGNRLNALDVGGLGGVSGVVIGNTFTTAHSLTAGFQAPTSGLLVEGQTVIGSSITVVGEQFTVVGGSASVAGYMGIGSQTLAQLQAIAPKAAGEMYYCSNCTVSVCVSSGTGTGAFVTMASRSTACN